MNKVQAEAFLTGLDKLERSFPAEHKKYGRFSMCVFIFRHADRDNRLDLKPLKEIDNEPAVWQHIQQLFKEVTGQPRH